MEHYAHQNYYNSLAVTESASFSNTVSVNKKIKILQLKRVTVQKPTYLLYGYTQVNLH